jgi:hypothetical protein
MKSISFKLSFIYGVNLNAFLPLFFMMLTFLSTILELFNSSSSISFFNASNATYFYSFNFEKCLATKFLSVSGCYESSNIHLFKDGVCKKKLDLFKGLI